MMSNLLIECNGYNLSAVLYVDAFDVWAQHMKYTTSTLTHTLTYSYIDVLSVRALGKLRLESFDWFANQFLTSFGLISIYCRCCCWLRYYWWCSLANYWGNDDAWNQRREPVTFTCSLYLSLSHCLSLSHSHTYLNFQLQNNWFARIIEPNPNHSSNGTLVCCVDFVHSPNVNLLAIKSIRVHVISIEYVAWEISQSNFSGEMLLLLLLLNN